MPMESEAPMLVRDFVDDPALHLDVVVEGDLDRAVNWVHVTELLDPTPYVEGGELILSAGVWDPRGVRADAFVGALARADAVALGWGLLAEDARVPEAVVGACRSEGLTLLAVPTRTPFIAIGRRFFDHVQARREASLRASIERSEKLVRAISTLPGGLRGVLRVLSESVPHAAWILGGDGRILASNVLDEPRAGIVSKVVERADRAEHEVPALLEGATAFVVGAGGHAPAHLVVDAPPAGLGVDQHAAIEQALPLLEFVIAHEQELREAERRLAAELVEAVLSGRTQFSAGRIRAYGLDPRASLVGVVVLVDEPDAALGTVRRTMASLRGDAVVAAWRDTITVIVQPANGAPSPDAMGRSLHNALAPGCAVGIGGESVGTEGLRRSLIQARQAASFARRRPRPGGYVVHDRVKSHALLLALQDEDVLTAFRGSLLGPIEEYDARRSTKLLPTLQAFLASGGQWQATADKLHVHVNTLRHRLARCEELTGKDLSSMDDRVDLYIAIRAPGASAPTDA